MMPDPNINFDIQNVTISNDNWNVGMWYESEDAENKVINEKNYSKFIDLDDIGNLRSRLAIKLLDNQESDKSCLISGIDGGSYLHPANNKDNGQTVKLSAGNLILSLGFTFFSYNIDKQEINWKLKPDIGALFDFYDLQDDYLVRGELGIQRIDSNGNIIWSYGGRDIWVNIHGKREVQIEEDKIKLTDFEGNEYVIDYHGQTLEDHPVIKVSGSRKKWWELWK